MAELLQLHFALTRSEYVNATRTDPSRAFRVGIIAGAAMLAGGLAAKLDLLTGLGLMAVVIGLVAYGLPYWRWMNFAGLQREQRWSIDADGCTVERDDSRARTGWTAYRELIDAGRVYVLVDDCGRSEVVPKRAFASEDDEAAFLALGREHVAVRDAGQTTSSGWTD